MCSTPDDTNLLDITEGRLYPYNESTAIYRCPAYNPVPAPMGIPHINPGDVFTRNYSMSGRMGGAAAQDAALYGVVDTSYELGSQHPQFKKLGDVANPDPSRALVFVDQSSGANDDCYFAISLTSVWQNSPTARHMKGGQFSFADGHVEQWKWRTLSREQDWLTPAVGGSSGRYHCRFEACPTGRGTAISLSLTNTLHHRPSQRRSRHYFIPFISISAKMML